MKFKTHKLFLSLFFALAFCFSFSVEASAHPYERSVGKKIYEHPDVEGVSAEEVEMAAPADKKEMTRKFVRHLATHLDLIKTDTTLDEDSRQERSREFVIFARELRQTGPFNNGRDVYSIAATTGRGYIVNHGLYQNLYGYKYDSSKEPLRTLLYDTMVPEFSGDNPDVEPACKEYGEENRVACAVRLETPARTRVTIMTGFHHAADGVAELPDCKKFTLTVKAKDVENANPSMKKELLELYVKEVIEKTKRLMADTAGVLAQEGILPGSPGYEQHFIARIYESVACYQKDPDLRYGSIYAFIMDPIEGVAFLSGNDFTRNGLSVDLNNADHMDRPVKYNGRHEEPNVLTAIHRTLTGTPPPDPPNLDDIADGQSGFFRYRWVNPTKPETRIDNYLEMGVTPGTALKESYIEVVNLSSRSDRPSYFVFGSGIYLEEKEDDDGCSIAATGNTPQGVLLNMLLIASVLFSAVFLRKRV